MFFRPLCAPNLRSGLSMAISLLLSPLAQSAGYVFPELGMMNVSTAGVGAQSIAEGAETVYANPAGMTRLGATSVAFNVMGVTSHIEFEDEGSEPWAGGNGRRVDAGSKMPALSAYWVMPLNDNWAFGTALASTAGSAANYGNDFSGSNQLTEVQLATVQFTPGLAYRFNDHFSVGMDLVVEYGVLEQSFFQGEVEVSTDSVEVGYAIGLMYEFNDAHRIGFGHRSQLDHDFEGDIKGNLGGMPLDCNADLNLTMPRLYLLSGYHEFDHQYALMWSAGYGEFDQVESTLLHIEQDDMLIRMDRDWDNTWAFGLGGHYQLNSRWRLEAGVAYESSLQDDPTKIFPDLPTAAIWKYGAGATYQFKSGWRAQTYYEYFDAGTPEIDALGIRGQYDDTLHFFGLMLNRSL